MGNLFHIFLYVALVISDVLSKPPNNTTTTTTAKPISKLLSKFHQNDYKLTYERTELVRSDARYGDYRVRTFKFNRTTAVLNGSFAPTLDLGSDVEVIAQAFRFASNEYREFPIRCEFNLCEALASKAFGLDTISTFGNLSCPFIKGKRYNLYNFKPDESRFPPLIPNGRYMLEFQFVFESKELFVLNNYGTIDRPISMPWA